MAVGIEGAYEDGKVEGVCVCVWGGGMVTWLEKFWAS